MRIRDQGWKYVGSGIWDGKKSDLRSGMEKSRIRDKHPDKDNSLPSQNLFRFRINQCFGSGSGSELDPDSIRSVDTGKVNSNFWSLFFSAVNFFQFWSWKLWIRIRIGIQPQMLDPDTDPDWMNPDSKHWNKFPISTPLPQNRPQTWDRIARWRWGGWWRGCPPWGWRTSGSPPATAAQPCTRGGDSQQI